MVIDPLFPTCPIRNILSRICVADTLCLIQTLGKKGRATYEELRYDLPDSPLSASLMVLKEDNIIVENNKLYSLSTIGKELYPLVSTFITWCEKNLFPSTTNNK
ncbi:transcriptional regulator [Prevotella melaninogenica]|jgi:putative transcriptional regulator|uniref:transcriptional regulator n=1 Tax=Prevotella melaninogenica TaxID=28132 RepID=UPI001C60F452|nr:transcriptional regulator [Prevotella melaninogenica]MBW4896671.1 transcriptional regulator [Prevotella melaninogenica]